MSNVNIANDALDGPAPEAGKKKSNLVKALLIILGVIAAEVIIAVVVVKKYVPSGGMAPMGSAAATAESAPKDEPGESGPIYEVKDVVVNPAGTQGTRFLSTTVALEFKNPKLLEELETREALIRDTLIGILSNKSLEDLYAPGAKDSLRVEILKRLNPRLTHGKVSRVYFTNYVIQ